jgi:hypothetical protein
MEIITGEMDGEKIVRAETVFDKIEKVLVEEHDCHASPEDGCDCGEIVGDRVGEINGVDSDEEYENSRDNNL